MENQRADYASQGSIWELAVTELTQYLDIELNSAIPRPKFQIGLVAIGLYVRFYRREGPGSPEDYPGTGGKVYQIRDDKVEVQDILSKIKGETKKK